MKKPAAIYILVVTAICLGIFLFRGEEGPQEIIEEPTPAETAAFELQHITEQLSDNLYIDADILYPEFDTCPSYAIMELSFDQSAAEAVFFPSGEDPALTYEDESGNTYRDGGYALVGGNGERLVKTPFGVSFINSRYQQNLETEDLMIRYAEKHAEQESEQLSFMSQEEAIALSTKAIQSCGIELIPVMEECIGLEYEELVAWQQELLKNESSFYDPFGKAYILPESSNVGGSYYLSFSFSQDDIPVLGISSPSVVFADAVMPPSPMYAKILISAEGIEHFDLYPTYTVTGITDRQPIILPDTAVAKVKEYYDGAQFFGSFKILSVYLEYVPIEKGGQTTLNPYWCVTMTGSIEEDGTSRWSDHLTAERINAFTGEDLKYGG